MESSNNPATGVSVSKDTFHVLKTVPSINCNNFGKLLIFCHLLALFAPVIPQLEDKLCSAGQLCGIKQCSMLISLQISFSHPKYSQLSDRSVFSYKLVYPGDFHLFSTSTTSLCSSSLVVVKYSGIFVYSLVQSTREFQPFFNFVIGYSNHMN